MGRIIVRVRGIDRRRDRRIREGIGLREMLGVVGRREGLRGEILVVVGRAEILGEIREGIGRLGIQVEIVQEGLRGEMPGIVLEILVGLHREILEGTDPVAVMQELGPEGMRLELREAPDRVELRREILEGIGLREMREVVDLQAITRGLRGILMRDFRKEAIVRRGNHDRSHSHNRGHNLSLSSDLSRGRRLRALDRVDSAGITMPEQRGRRAIAVEPVQVAVAETGEVETNEIARVDVWIDRRGAGGFWFSSFAGAECGSEDVSYISRGGEGICDGGEGE
jgi:hypothetical protein